MSFCNDIQTAIYQRLSTYPALTAIVSGVYDDVPQANGRANDAYPYVTIGDDSLVADAQDDAVGFSGSIVIHSWSISRGRKQIKSIQGEIFNALSRYDLPITTRKLITLEWASDSSFIDADSVTRHGVSTYSITAL